MANFDILIDRFINGSPSESRESLQELLIHDWWTVVAEILSLLFTKDWATRERATESIAISIFIGETITTKQATECFQPTAKLLGQAYGTDSTIESREGPIRQQLWNLLLRFLLVMPEDEVRVLDQVTIESLTDAVRYAEAPECQKSARIVAQRLGRFYKTLAGSIAENLETTSHQNQRLMRKLQRETYETLGDIGPNSIGQVGQLVVALLENAEDACRNLSIPLTANQRVWSVVEEYRRSSSNLRDGIPAPAVYPNQGSDEWFLLPEVIDDYVTRYADFELCQETIICCACGAALQKIDPTGVAFAAECQRLFKSKHVRWRPLALLTTIPLLRLSWDEAYAMLQVEIKRFLSYRYEHYPVLICNWIQESTLTGNQRLQLLECMLDFDPDQPQLEALMRELGAHHNLAGEQLSLIAAKLPTWLQHFRSIPEDCVFWFQYACENGLLEFNMPIGFAQVLLEHKGIREWGLIFGGNFEELSKKAQQRIDQGNGTCL